MSLRIRPATRRDARALGAVHVASWRDAYRGILPERFLAELRPEEAARRFRGRIAQAENGAAQILLAEVDGAVAGFSIAAACPDPSLADFAGEIEMLYVHPDRTGGGLGGALVEQARDDLAASGFYWLVIWVLAQNQRARAFYERMGLRLDGAARVDLIAGRPVHVVRYAAALNPVVDFDALRRERAGRKP